MFFGFDLIQAIQTLGYPGIFAIVLAESGLFFGVSLPGGSLLFTAGLLASQGLLNIYILFATIIIAAVLGDTIGYWFGAWVGPALYRRKDSRFFKQSHIEQARFFFDQHGSKAILLGRFVPIVRTFVPIVAGVVRMEYRTFLFYNFLGALVWGGGFTLLGYFLGEAVPEIEKYIVLIVLGIMVVTFVPFVFHLIQQRRSSAAKPAFRPKPRAVIFDLDDTLAESFQPPHDRILEKLYKLAEQVPVAVMTGATFSRIERDIMTRMPKDLRIPFYVFSDNAARADAWTDGSWAKKYGMPLEGEEREALARAIKEVVTETDVMNEEEEYRVIDRGTSVSFVAFKDGVPANVKNAWDPDFTKRRTIADALRTKVPGYNVLIAGKTTIDIVRDGISKAYGVEWLSSELTIPSEEMLFVGDAFYEGGNDAVVISTGIQTYATSGPEETEKMIDEMLR